jgi:hypothetical protein
LPAYGGEIEDCQVLIGFFTGKFKAGEVPTTNAGGKAATAQLQGVKELEIRKVESDFKGMTLKKKGDDEDMGGLYGGSGKKGKKGKSGKAPASGTATPGSTEAPATTSGGSVNLPMSLLSALLALGIPPPSGKEDVPRTVNDLETKKSWFEANSEAKTKVSKAVRGVTSAKIRYRLRLRELRNSSRRCRRRMRSWQKAMMSRRLQMGYSTKMRLQMLRSPALRL